MIDPHAVKLADPGAVALAGVPVAMPVASPEDAGVFKTVFAEAVARVENYRGGAEQSVARFLAGDDEEIHKAAVAIQRADLAFDMFLQVQTKVVQAYQEVMRMQI
ncbi:MAG: flagellar hook-basal body complex protein FliE [Acidobacteria bacterium]|nr:flagellar hook-basal body complex protein FliE [Acidobacteriota bacterium]